MATILYARVSSTEQTIEHQRTQAEQAGFGFDEVIADGGVSGVSTKLRETPSRAPTVRHAPQRRYTRCSVG
jgi:putative DNA-invertase from lambdoid prophage Rac